MARVLEVTKHRVIEGDPAEVTTGLIAECAGVSAAWVYQYFDDREQIFDVVVLDAMRRLRELTRKTVLNPMGRDLREIVQASIEANFRFGTDEPAFMRLHAARWYSKGTLEAHQMLDLGQAEWLHQVATERGILQPGDATQQVLND